MPMYFGTDGIRGIACKDLNIEIAQKLGNALGQILKKGKIVIGRDTRTSGCLLTNAFACGAMLAGVNVIDVGIIPTAGIAFLTKSLGADYGVMVSASHNPPQYNGLKVFDRNGMKLSEKEESHLEEYFSSQLISPVEKLGKYKQEPLLSKKYLKHLINSTDCSFDKLKIVLDCSNGAAYKIAPQAFKALNAEVIQTACNNDGRKINDNCGSLYIENLINIVKENNADIGFAFDGDSDRIIAVDNDLTVFDGDKLIYILAKYMQQKGKLKNNTVVGTSHTNSGICRALEKNKINMVRTDIGDKYVIEAMQNMNLNLGGEQSGHIILSDFATTGDGILTAIKIAEIMTQTQKTLNQLFDVKLYPQENRTFITKDKLRIINSEKVNDAVKEILSLLPISGRVLVRASGTEPKIRIMVESSNGEDAKKYADQLVALMKNLEH